MNREDIIRMAEECGIPEFENNESQAENIMRFAALVASAEREACAKVCELMWHEWLDSPEENEPNKPDAEDCYRAIRKRGQA